MRNFISMTAILSAIVMISGCDKTREVFGLKRTQVDEFGVVDRHPLSTPPNYNLRPPLKNAKNLAHNIVNRKAKKAVFGSNVGDTSVPVAAGEKAFLNEAGATNLDPDVRSKIADENPAIEKEGLPSVGEDLVFWKNKSTRKNDDVIDPQVENEKYNR